MSVTVEFLCVNTVSDKVVTQSVQKLHLRRGRPLHYYQQYVKIWPKLTKPLQKR